MLRIYRPAIFFLFAIILGILVGVCFPGNRVAFAAFLLVLLGLAPCFASEHKFLIVFVSALFFIYGHLAICRTIAPNFPENHTTRFADGKKKKKITGIVETRPFADGNRVKMVVLAETIDGMPVVGKIRLTIINSETEIFIGDRISFSGKIRRPSNFNNPGGFDYERYMAFKGIWTTVFTKGRLVSVVQKNVKTGFSEMLGDYRDKISDLVEKTKRSETKGIMKALIVGDRSGIPRDQTNAFRRAGVSHILAISGLHIGIVACFSFFVFLKLFSLFKNLLWEARVEKVAAVFSLPPVFFYGLVAGMQPSTQRAVIMVSVFLAAYVFERLNDSINAAAVAGLLILAACPSSLFSISFQLSFSAVFWIIYGMKRFYEARNKERKLSAVLEKFIGFAMVSLFAILGTLPLVMYYFNQASPIGLLTNIIVVPPAGFAIVPLGLLSVFVYPINADIALLGLNADAEILSIVIWAVEKLSSLPFSSIKTFTPTLPEICCYYLFLWAILNVLFVPEDIPESRTAEMNFTVKTAKRLIAACLLFFFADGCYWTYQRFYRDDLRTTVIDIGQGTSSLVELPAGHCVMIDGGGFFDNSVFDVGERIIAPLLWRKRIMTVDTVILSHSHKDHMNGLIYIVENFNVKNVWTTNEFRPDEKFVESVVKKGLPMPRFETIFGEHSINGAKLEILYPPVDFFNRKKYESWRTKNNNSMVVRVSLDGVSFLFPGDIEANAERELAGMMGNGLQSDVLIAPHHGSKTSSTDVFLDSAAPKIVVIPAGQKNRFGYPHSAVMERYKKRGYKVFRTDLCGAVSMKTDGTDLDAESCLNCSER